MTGRAMVMVCCCMAVAGCSQIGGLLNGGDEDVAGLPLADLVDTDGASVGTVTFEQTPNGMLVRADVHDLPRGTHGFHIHAVGKCERPGFESAGGHFNPFNRRHGVRNSQGAHVGDLPNITVESDGTGRAETVAAQATLAEGAARLFDDDGSAVVIHERADDYESDPSGNAGARIACGVIRR